MACTIDASVGGVGANSYASIAAADAYHAGHLESERWSSLETGQKCQALQQATIALDSRMRWIGFQSFPTQALAWPRIGAIGRNGYEVASNVIPVEVIRATADLARRLALRSLEVQAAAGGGGAATFKSIKAGPVTLEYNTAGAVAAATDVSLDTDMVGDEVYYMLEGLGRLRVRGSVGSVSLRRV